MINLTLKDKSQNILSAIYLPLAPFIIVQHWKGLKTLHLLSGRCYYKIQIRKKVFVLKNNL